MIEITSPANPQIKLAAKLRRRRHRQAHRLCLLEGTRLVQDALSIGAAFHTCFITARRRRSPARPCGPHPESLSAPPRARRPSRQDQRDRIAADHCRRDPHPRAASAFPRRFLPRSGRRAGSGQCRHSPAHGRRRRRRSGPVRARLRRPVQWQSLAGSDGRALSRPNPHPAALGSGSMAALPTGQSLYLASAQGSILYDEVDWRNPSALVLGSEAHGASSQLQEKAAAIAIPMAAATESLNVAAAGAVILYEAARQRRKPSENNALTTVWPRDTLSTMEPGPQRSSYKSRWKIKQRTPARTGFSLPVCPFIVPTAGFRCRRPQVIALGGGETGNEQTAVCTSVKRRAGTSRFWRMLAALLCRTKGDEWN